MSAPTPRIQSAAAARILGVSQRCAQQLALRGEIPGAARIGGIWTFDTNRLSAFVAQRDDRQDVNSRHALGPVDPFEHENLKKGRVVCVRVHGPKLAAGRGSQARLRATTLVSRTPKSDPAATH